MRKETIKIPYNGKIYTIKKLSQKIRVPITTIKYRYENGLNLRRGAENSFVDLNTGKVYPSLRSACIDSGENYSTQYYRVTHGKPLIGSIASLDYRWRRLKYKDEKIKNWIDTHVKEIESRMEIIRNASCTNERRKHLNLGTQKMIQFLQYVKQTHSKLNTSNSKELNSEWKHLKDEYNVEVL